MNWKTKLALNLMTEYLLPAHPKRRQRGATAAWMIGGAASLLAARAVLRKMNEYDLAGKSVLITGGSRGLGMELAREFCRRGARVAICARDIDELTYASLALLREGCAVQAFACDLTNQQQVEVLLEDVKNYYGQLDVLVNNAGIISVGPVEEMTTQDFEQAMQTNYYAALYTILAALPDMKARRRGRIVNVVSIGGKISVPHLVPYSASKFALAGLSKGLRAELRKDGIVVTTIYPGLMRTGSPRNATFKGQHRAEYAWFSISDSSPVLSMNAERAAREIVSACQQGTDEVVLSFPAKIAAQLNACFPTLMTDLLGVVNQFLPRPGGIGRDSATGRDSESWLSPSWLTARNEEAARRNNQIH